MGQPAAHAVSRIESIDARGEPGELKHLTYPEERTSTETPSVVASESGSGQWPWSENRNRLESRAVAGDSPVRVVRFVVLE